MASTNNHYPRGIPFRPPQSAVQRPAAAAPRRPLLPLALGAAALVAVSAVATALVLDRPAQPPPTESPAAAQVRLADPAPVPQLKAPPEKETKPPPAPA